MEYVYTNKSLPSELCKTIIQKYEENREYIRPGVTAAGMNKEIKDTNDLMIPDINEWKEINAILSTELHLNLKLYVEQIQKGDHYNSDKNFGIDYKLLGDWVFVDNEFMIQKYDKQKGKYVYHNDAAVYDDKSRVITFLWYLNDVTEGGETEFFGGSSHIVPECGKLLLFPAVWTYPHRGNVPLSSDKYIITGWLYIKNIKKKKNAPPFIESIPKKRMDERSPEFDYFYNVNKLIFMDYKCKAEGKKRLIKPIHQQIYSSMICDWIIEKSTNLIGMTEVDTISELNTFLISSFVIIVEKIKIFYHIECVFKINKWYLLPEIQEDVFEDIDYDLCIQIDLSTGISYVSLKYIPIQYKYTIVYFIQFELKYFKDCEETSFLLKEIAEPSLAFIESTDPTVEMSPSEDTVSV